MSLKLCTEVICPQKQNNGMKKVSWKWFEILSLERKSNLSGPFLPEWTESLLVLGNSCDRVNMFNDICKEVYVCSSGA